MPVGRFAFLYPGSSLPMEGRKSEGSGIELTVAFPVLFIGGMALKQGNACRAS